jgi:hypothetical protein
MENTKRDLSLDFTKPRHPRSSGQTAPSLVTPILNLSTPELNKMISEDELAVLTPNGISSVIPQSNVLPSPLIPTTVNCNNIITNSNSNNNNNNNLQNSNKCNAIDNHANQNQNRKKRTDKSREVDVDKIEKKRERNRLAAKKCRQRKVETIEELRKTVSDWELKYQRLEAASEESIRSKEREIEMLRRENADLRNQLARR